MLTFFDPDEYEEFQAARDLLVRRCADWAAGRGLAADPLVISAALDWRHLSVDGRLAFWSPAHVDLGDDFEETFGGERPFSAADSAWLAEELTKPGPLVALTALGTRAMRERLLAEGREAALIGELVAAEPAELLGVVAQHYPPESSAAEIAGWLAARGGDAAPLLEAVRTCQFRGRAAAMLSVLAMTAPDAAAWLDGLRDDPVLAPLVLTALLDADYLRPDDLAEREQALVMTEGLLQLLEIGGPDVVREQLRQLPARDRPMLLAAMRQCEHPAVQAMRDFQVLVAGPAAAEPRRLNGPRRPGTKARSHPARKARKRGH